MRLKNEGMDEAPGAIGWSFNVANNVPVIVESQI